MSIEGNRQLSSTGTRRTAPARREGLVCHELDDEAVVFDNALTNTYRLNATAYLVWQGCDGCSAVETIVRRIAERYAVPESQAANDVAAALDHMESVGLVAGGWEGARWER